MLAAIGLVLLLAGLWTMGAAAGAAPEGLQVIYLKRTASAPLVAGPPQAQGADHTPRPILLFNLPLVKQDAARLEPVMLGEKDPTPLPTPTPTPVPPQTSAQNAPIMVGAVIIVSIIVLAWIFLGRRAWKNGG